MTDLERAHDIAKKIIAEYQAINEGPVQMKWALENLIAAALMGD